MFVSTDRTLLTRIPAEYMAPTVRFECRLAPEAPCDVTWYLNERALQPGRDFQLESLEDGTQRLTVQQAFPDDAGVLTCEAESERGVATTSTQLLVESEPGEHRTGSTGRSRPATAKWRSNYTVC